MKVLKVDHIGVAVKNIEKSLADWERLFGLKSHGVEELEERGVRLALLEIGKGSSVELVSPLNEEAAVAKFLRERGEGIHHFCLQVDDIEGAMAELKAQGIRFIQERPQKGAKGSLISFIHPHSVNGVLIELKEEKKS